MPREEMIMRQVLLKSVGRHAPVRMWMLDTVQIGDTFSWRDTEWSVSAIYGTHFSVALPVRPCEKPKHHSSPGIPIDQN